MGELALPSKITHIYFGLGGFSRSLREASEVSSFHTHARGCVGFRLLPYMYGTRPLPHFNDASVIDLTKPPAEPNEVVLTLEGCRDEVGDGV